MKARGLLAAAAVAAGCVSEAPGVLPLAPPPEGSVLAGEAAGLEVYVDGASDVCLGSVRRAERHWRALLEVLGEEALEGRVVLFGVERSEEVRRLCRGYVDGCAYTDLAVAKPKSLPHELVHHALDRWVGGAHPVPMLLSEGLATYWSGEHIPDWRRKEKQDWPQTPWPMEALIEANAREVNTSAYSAAMHVVAWLEWEHGREGLLEAYRLLAKREDAVEAAATVLPEVFGYADLGQMQAAFDAEAAYYYPRSVDSAWRPAVEDLEYGVEWARETCPGPAQVGPEVQGYLDTLSGALEFIPRMTLEVEAGGVYGAVANVPTASGGAWQPRTPRGGIDEPIWEWYVNPSPLHTPDCPEQPLYGIYFELPAGRYDFWMAPWESELAAAGGVVTAWIWRAGSSCDDPAFRPEPPPGLPPPPPPAP